MRVDMHVHSSHSDDGRQSVEEIVHRCVALGIHAVSITDHNSLRGSMDALRLKIEGCLIIPGMEVTTAPGGHFLAYNIGEEVPRGLPVQEAIDLVHRQGGIAVAAHPYRIWSGLGEKAVRRANFDAVEVLNSRSLRSSNRRAKALAQSLGIGMTGGSDAHNTGQIGAALTLVPDDCGSAEDVIRAVTSRKSSTEGCNRALLQSFGYGAISIGRWCKRGFRRL